MTNPFVWMVGQLKRAAEGLLPAEAVILAPCLREVYEQFHKRSPMTTAELAVVLDIAHDTARRRIYRAVEAGIIERVEYPGTPSKYIRNAQFRLKGKA